MNKILALCCAAAGLASVGATDAQAAQPVNTLPTIAHVNETVILVRRHHRRGHWVWRHHHRVWVRY